MHKKVHFSKFMHFCTLSDTSLHTVRLAKFVLYCFTVGSVVANGGKLSFALSFRQPT